MRKLIAVLAVLLAVTFVVYAQQTAAKGPTELVIKAKNGNILFPHAKHVATEKGDCKVCHPKLWPQSATAPIGFRPPHKNEEAKEVSCGACHRAGGPAFSASVPANCKKCHGTAKAAAK